jgi:hypothetical protein
MKHILLIALTLPTLSCGMDFAKIMAEEAASGGGSFRTAFDTLSSIGSQASSTSGLVDPFSPAKAANPWGLAITAVSLSYTAYSAYRNKTKVDEANAKAAQEVAKANEEIERSKQKAADEKKKQEEAEIESARLAEENKHLYEAMQQEKYAMELEKQRLAAEIESLNKKYISRIELLEKTQADSQSKKNISSNAPKRNSASYTSDDLYMQNMQNMQSMRSSIVFK